MSQKLQRLGACSQRQAGACTQGKAISPAGTVSQMRQVRAPRGNKRQVHAPDIKWIGEKVCSLTAPDTLCGVPVKTKQTILVVRPLHIIHKATT